MKGIIDAIVTIIDEGFWLVFRRRRKAVVIDDAPAWSADPFGVGIDLDTFTGGFGS